MDNAQMKASLLRVFEDRGNTHSALYKRLKAAPASEVAQFLREFDRQFRPATDLARKGDVNGALAKFKEMR